MKMIYSMIAGLVMLSAQIANGQTFTSIDIAAGSASSSPSSLTEYNGKVYFNAGSIAEGNELWVSDGSATGTHLLKDLRPGPGSSYPTNLQVINNLLFFIATDSIHGNELWTSDGTAAGTAMVTDIYPGLPSSQISFMTALNNKAYFTATEGTNGYELWVSDGTSTGTSLLKDIYPGVSGSSPTGFFATNNGLAYGFNLWNNKLYFRATDATHGMELWATDGTTTGTNIVADILPGPGSSFPYAMTPLNNSLIFSANDSIHGSEIWTTDGTAGNTALLKDINPLDHSSTPGGNSGYLQLGSKLYFAAFQNATGYELWQTDGTTSGTTIVKDILPGPGSSSAATNGMGVYNGKLYFSASDSINGEQLWSTDGSSANTLLFKVLSDVVPFSATPLLFTPYNGQLLFTADAGISANGRQLWTSDGTVAGTHIIAPAISPTADPLGSQVQFCVSNGKLFFEANYNSIGDELWIYSTPTTSITETADDHSVSAYPNPFSSAISLSGLKSDERYDVQVTDMTGRVCYATELAHVSQSISINTPAMAPGVYVMRITGKTDKHTFRMVKE